MTEPRIEPLLDSVLPPVPDSGLTDIGELLSPEEQQALRDDLARIARMRRRAEAESANIIVGGS